MGIPHKSKVHYLGLVGSNKEGKIVPNSNEITSKEQEGEGVRVR